MHVVWCYTEIGFFFSDTATAEIYTLSLHDALPISAAHGRPLHLPRLDGAGGSARRLGPRRGAPPAHRPRHRHLRSEEHTSELQSRQYLVCRLLLEKTKTRVPSFRPITIHCYFVHYD